MLGLAQVVDVQLEPLTLDEGACEDALALPVVDQLAGGSDRSRTRSADSSNRRKSATASGLFSRYASTLSRSATSGELLAEAS